MKIKLYGAVALVAAVAPFATFAQGSPEEYQRALSVTELFGSKNVYNSDVNPVWLTGSGAHKCWYWTNTPDGWVFKLVDAKTRQVKPLFNRSRLALELAAALGTEVDSCKLVLGAMKVSEGADTLRFDNGGHHWTFAIASGKLSDGGVIPPAAPQRHWMETDDEKQFRPVASPDGKREAFMRDDNVWVRELPSGKARQLTLDGRPGRYYSAYLQWSPDGRYLATSRIRPAEKRYVYYVESSPADQLQPRLHKQEYAKPGDELMFKAPVVIEVESGKMVSAPDATFEPQFNLGNIAWDGDSRAITFEFNERGHKRYAVMKMDAATGQVDPIIDERADTYIMYQRAWRHDMADGRRILWLSERDNYGHIYLYDRSKPGKEPRQVTRGEWYVRDVVKVDEKNGKIYFSANGVNKNEDPYNIKYYVINFDGSGMKCLTPAPGYHMAWFSPSMDYLVDVVSSPVDAPIATLRSVADNKEVMELERADISRILANGWVAPEVFVAPGRDGVTPMWGIIQRPSNFDPSKKYPVIEYIYQGPHDHFVPKKFLSQNYWTQTMAELGFIVVMVDGMSTAFRSREFENVCYKNLKDAGLPDHIAWMKAAAEKYPYMDLDRVGIYGMSAGGQESLNAMLQHPDFYKACYSSCGCHDNRMDKVWWNELWMGYPVDESYVECSNVANAHKLQGALMLVVGEMDDNVDPASTMQVVNALIKANKDFELIVVPGAHHTMGEKFGDRKRFDFFVRNLTDNKPPKW